MWGVCREVQYWWGRGVCEVVVSFSNAIATDPKRVGSIRNPPNAIPGRPTSGANSGGNTPTRTSSVSGHRLSGAPPQAAGKFSSLSGTSGQKYKSTLDQIRSVDSDGKPGDHMTG